MTSTRKKRQQNKKIFSQLCESDIDFMIGQNNLEAQTENRTNTVEQNVTSTKINSTTHINDSEVDVHTLEKNIVNKVRSDVDSVMTTVETRVQDGMLSATESLVFPRVENVPWTKCR